MDLANQLGLESRNRQLAAQHKASAQLAHSSPQRLPAWGQRLLMLVIGMLMGGNLCFGLVHSGLAAMGLVLAGALGGGGFALAATAHKRTAELQRQLDAALVLLKQQ